MKFSQIEAKAEKTAMDAGVWGMFPVPLERIAGKLGYMTREFDSNPKISGAIHYDTNTIFINKNESLVRQRFTLAHEIGHAVLHGGENIIDYRAEIDGSTDPQEKEANYFAANLLMPRKEFERAWRLFAGDAGLAGAYFGVSGISAGYRAKNLGLK